MQHVKAAAPSFNDRNAIRQTINNTNLVKFDGERRSRRRCSTSGTLHVQVHRTGSDAVRRHDFEEEAANNRSVCFACQKSSVIFVSDGSPTHDGAIPGTFGVAANTMIADAAGNYRRHGRLQHPGSAPLRRATPPPRRPTRRPARPVLRAAALGRVQRRPTIPIPSYLPKVAWYLHNVDARVNTENDAGGYPMTGKQSLDVLTIGLGVRNQQAEILSHTATAGGGRFFADGRRAGAAQGDRRRARGGEHPLGRRSAPPRSPRCRRPRARACSCRGSCPEQEGAVGRAPIRVRPVERVHGRLLGPD